ncbi:unnamed protein product [Ixodes persulcatus]
MRKVYLWWRGRKCQQISPREKVQQNMQWYVHIYYYKHSPLTFPSDSSVLEISRSRHRRVMCIDYGGNCTEFRGGQPYVRNDGGQGRMSDCLVEHVMEFWRTQAATFFEKGICKSWCCVMMIALLCAVIWLNGSYRYMYINDVYTETLLPLVVCSSSLPDQTKFCAPPRKPRAITLSLDKVL